MKRKIFIFLMEIALGLVIMLISRRISDSYMCGGITGAILYWLFEIIDKKVEE